MSDNVFTPRRCDWSAKWNGSSLGTLNKVTPDLKLVTEAITRGSTGKHKLGKRIVALEGTVKIECADVTATLLAFLQPWVSGNQTTQYLTPPTLNQDLYAYAQLLTLHPLDMTDQTQDINLIKTVPITLPAPERDGLKDDVLMVEFEPYPDRTQITASPPVIVYGYLGPVPG